VKATTAKKKRSEDWGRKTEKPSEATRPLIDSTTQRPITLAPRYHGSSQAAMLHAPTKRSRSSSSQDISGDVIDLYCVPFEKQRKKKEDLHWHGWFVDDLY